MTAIYTTPQNVADFLRFDIDGTTSPNTQQITEYIERNQCVIDNRTGMTYGQTKTETNEWQDLHLIYTFGWGTFTTLKRRAVKVDACTGLHFCSGAGDKLEVWSGATGAFNDETDAFGTYNVIAERGEVYLRGFLFSILRKNRLRITYRYGEVTVPGDISKACLLMTCIDIVRSSFRMDEIAFGGSAINKETSMRNWEDEIERIIRNREEVYFIP